MARIFNICTVVNICIYIYVCFSSNTNLCPFLQSDPIYSFSYTKKPRSRSTWKFPSLWTCPKQNTFQNKNCFFSPTFATVLLLLFVFLLPPSAAFADGPASSAGPLDFDFFESFLTFFLGISELRLWSDWVFPSWKDFLWSKEIWVKLIKSHESPGTKNTLSK